MTEQVYVANNTTYKPSKYHTNEDCDSAPSNPREVSKAKAEQLGLELCRVCERGWQPYEREGKSLGQKITAGELDVDL